ALYFAEQGYAVVVQDTRGRNDSDGEWYAFKNEADDGHASIEWAAGQSWSNGKVATMGGSYLAIDQWLAATRGSSHLAAMVVLVSPSDLYSNTIYPGGAFQLGTAASWAVGTGRHRMMAEEMTLISWPQIFRHLPVESNASAALVRYFPGRDDREFRRDDPPGAPGGAESAEASRRPLGSRRIRTQGWRSGFRPEIGHRRSRSGPALAGPLRPW
ncbi:MAG: CocE/NonD family hydrolase, partial [Acidobacteria bacterium]|nr:CocE/NonD family hydrolase [Acidobacteriota bacterium]